jgi:hypothetical protein
MSAAVWVNVFAVIGITPQVIVTERVQQEAE